MITAKKSVRIRSDKKIEFTPFTLILDVLVLVNSILVITEQVHSIQCGKSELVRE